jgi:F-type H+-transporting ATPase subunit a
MYHYSWTQLVLDSGLGHALEGLGLDHNSQIALLSTWVMCGVLIAFALVARGSLDKLRALGGSQQFLFTEGLGLRNIFELLTEFLWGLVETALGPKNGAAWFWLLGGIFTWILASNLFGLLPGWIPATGDINSNLSMALVVLVAFNYAGIKANGIGAYLHHMWGPVWWLGVLLFPVEVIALYVVRPISLSLRLGGNIFGDHMVFGIMSDLVALGLPSVFLGLGVFVSGVQALVFTLLSSVYISLAIGDEHGHDHH